MSYPRARLAALAIALACSATVQAQGQGLQPRRSPDKPSGVRPDSLPLTLDADRLEGVPGEETTAQGNATLRRGSLSIRADSLKFREQSEDVEARGNVRLEREGDVLTGPALKYRVRDATGVFEKPDFTFAPHSKPGQRPVTARGQAESIELLGEKQFRIKDGSFTSCKPGDDGWFIRADELDLDFTREVGTARGGGVYFKGVHIIAAPSIDFSLNNQRKSGLLPPSIGTTGKSGPELAVPYYLNLAPNYDLTLTPRYMEKRGLQIAEQFRYLQTNYHGEFSAEELPRDRATDSSRSAITLVHSYNRDGALVGGLNLNKVSDDNYFRDLATRINVTSQATLPREGFLTYNGNWWSTGSYSATVRVQRFQILQDPNQPVVSSPTIYGRTPQLTLSTLRQDIGGFDFGSSAEFVDFSHPAAVVGNPLEVVGKRSMVYPSLKLPLIAPGAYLTPKLGVHYTYYSLEHADPGTPDTISRTLPIFSLDSGLIFEREGQAQGQAITQTLEPRLYYVRVPFRDQSRIPLFDTAVADFSYAQIFSENSFSGGDRINDADQLTVALTSRVLRSSTGQEMLRGTIGQWTAEAATQYNQRDNQAERLTVTTRYQPEPLKTLNLSYRFLRDPINPIRQVDLSGQWPLFDRWYGVGRFNYSLRDSRIVESIGGFEYAADCWVSRIVVQRFALTAGTSTTSVFAQLELNGFSQLGSNPLEALKRNIPGYRQINAAPPDANPDRPFDFYQ